MGFSSTLLGSVHYRTMVGAWLKWHNTMYNVNKRSNMHFLIYSNFHVYNCPNPAKRFLAQEHVTVVKLLCYRSKNWNTKGLAVAVYDFCNVITQHDIQSLTLPVISVIHFNGTLFLYSLCKFD